MQDERKLIKTNSGDVNIVMNFKKTKVDFEFERFFTYILFIQIHILTLLFKEGISKIFKALNLFIKVYCGSLLK